MKSLGKQNIAFFYVFYCHSLLSFIFICLYFSIF